ncbi:MAG TPA: DUF6542 domain-containing protein [Streptosporangiaceae bacterium]
MPQPQPQPTWRSPARPGTRPAERPDDARLPDPPVRLTGRGAIVILLGLTFAGLLVSDWLSLSLLGDATFIAACAGIAVYTKPSDLLPVAVCPPLVFLVACACAKVATSAGGMSAAEGTLVTLGNSAPWLFVGTAATVVVGLRRGLLGNLRELRRGLHGDPDQSASDGSRQAPDRRPR